MRMYLKLTCRWSLFEAPRKGKGKTEAAWQEGQRRSLTRPPQEFPPAKSPKPTFLPRDFQVALLFRGRKNLTFASERVNRSSCVVMGEVDELRRRCQQTDGSCSVGYGRRFGFPPGRKCSRLGWLQPWACSRSATSPRLARKLLTLSRLAGLNVIAAVVGDWVEFPG